MSYRAATLEIDRGALCKASSFHFAHLDSFGVQASWHRHLDLLPMMVSWSSADGLDKFYNQAWIEFTGVSPSTCRLFSEWSLIHPEDRAQAQRAWFRALATGADYELTLRMAHCDGGYRTVVTKVGAERSPRNTITGWYIETAEVHPPHLYPTVLHT